MAANFEERAKEFRNVARILRSELKEEDPSPRPAAQSPSAQASAEPAAKRTNRQIAVDILREKGTPMPMTELLVIMQANGSSIKSIGNLSSLLSRDKKTFRMVSRGIWTLQDHK